MGSVVSRISESPGESATVFGAVFVVTYLLYRRYVSDNGRKKLPPAFPSLPVIGSIPFLPTKLEDLAEFCISPKNKLGKIFSFRVGPKYVLVISGKKAIHEALVTKAYDFADRPFFFAESLVNKDAKGIIFGRYDSEYKSHRQLCVAILKRFGFGQRVMETRILMEVEEMIQRLRAERGCPMDISHLTTSCVANVVLNMLFGRRFCLEDVAFQQLISDYNDLTAFVTLVLDIFPLLRFVPYFKRKIAESLTTANRCFDFMNTNIALCLQNEPKIESFVSCFVEAHGPDYDRKQLLMTIRDLVAAGMETTATSIRWAVVLLANHQSVQERLHQEIDSVIGRQRLPTLDDRSRLPYVEATIMELMRHKTLAPLGLAHSNLKDTEVDGYFIPKGAMVLFSIHSAHMDPEDWQDPQRFRPERFLDESGNVINKDRIIPFSLGKRSCLGEQLARQEIFFFVVALLQNFDFRPPEGQDSIDVHEVWATTNAPSEFKVRMIPRDANSS